MDQSVGATQKLIIILAILLAFLLIFFVGYSLWSKAKRAESELAQKTALENITKQNNTDASITISDNNKTSNFSFESLTSNSHNISTTSDSGFATIGTSQENTNPKPVTITNVSPKPTQQYTAAPAVDYDRPLTAEEIRKIRMLPIDTSATGKLQNQLQTETNGQYQAQYK